MESTKESKDLVEKHFVAFPDVAADIINALLYGGDVVVRPENLLPASTETLYSSGEKGTLRNQYEDLAKYEIRNGKVSTIYLFANQSAVDYRMVLRGAGYIGGVYREQYEGKHPNLAPVVEMVLYWGRKRWNGARSLRHMFRRKKIPPEVWKHVDDIRLRMWEMRYLSTEMRERFTSDMRIVLDYLAEGEGYRSDRPVVHKEALIKMLRVLDGDRDVTDTIEILQEMNITEEDEITVCELFDQYIRKGHKEGHAEGVKEGIIALINVCRDVKLSFEETAERVRSGFHLEDAEVQENMRLYW